MRRVGDDAAAGGLDDIASHDGVLIVLRDELTDQDENFGRNASLYLHLGAHPTAAATHAHFVLPTSLHSEQEGTFTNLEGRVQRFWPALHAPGAARPTWLVLSAVLAHREAGTMANTAAEAFNGLVASHAPFTGLSFESLGTQGAIVNEPVSLPTGD
jgi:NADH dehydrogenase/NADH:ubiquinone oxidoreductase subunit G